MGGLSLRRMLAVFAVETKQLLLDRFVLVLIFGIPVLQILLYGYAVSLEPQHVPLALASNDARVAERIVGELGDESRVRLVGKVGRPGEAARAVRDGRAVVGVELDYDTSDATMAVRIVADDSDPAVSRPVVSGLETSIWRRAVELYSPAQAPTVDIDWLFTPKSRASNSVAPGLVGLIVMVTMLFLGAMSLVRERERGTWESLLATPVRPAEALLGKLAPYLAMGLLQTVILLAVIHVLFGVPLPVSSLALIASAPLFASAYLLLGFAFSAVAQTQLQAVQAAVGVYLPSLLLSGFLFPFSGMPDWAQAIGECLPITHYIRASREILLRQDPALSILPHLPPIALFAALALVAALVSYRRRLD